MGPVQGATTTVNCQISVVVVVVVATTQLSPEAATVMVLRALMTCFMELFIRRHQPLSTNLETGWEFGTRIRLAAKHLGVGVEQRNGEIGTRHLGTGKGITLHFRHDYSSD